MRPAAVAGAAALALGAAAPAHADEHFPATAGSTLVSLSHHGGGSVAEGSWGRVYVGSDVGDDYPSADFSADLGGVGALVGTGGPVESRVNTTAAGDGRAEAVSALSGGFTLDLPGHGEPAVSLTSLHNSVRCDFSGDLSWENTVGSSAEDDRVISVFGTPITADAPEVNATVDVPGLDTAADVTVLNRVPEDASAGRGEVSTSVTASAGGAELFALELGAVAVDCLGDEGAPGTDGGEDAGGGDGSGEDDTAAAREDPAAPESGEPSDGSDSGDATDGGAPGGGAPGGGARADGDAPADGRGDTGGEPSAAPESPDPVGAADGPADLPLTGGALAGLVTAGVLALGGGGAALYLARRGKHGDGSGDDAGDGAAQR
ncbi:hypothetical protein [Nocardiopsis tropica]|uniref:LPXTG-motif cell wall anchor domain-containing protein n=2 Tax=Nocardiopsis tropica TaxID=109330 RepID=A0ABU7L0M3_9ACTN|nr:hypothetical protein [Nocardiopsis umidischolae]MEE2055105.1 hypothetical protein [Nocardiopsis umidischolae]